MYDCENVVLPSSIVCAKVTNIQFVFFYVITTSPSFQKVPEFTYNTIVKVEEESILLDKHGDL